MRRTLLGILACAGCGDGGPPRPAPAPAPVEWAYPPPGDNPGIAPVAAFGRGQDVAYTEPVGLAGKARPLLQHPTVWQVPDATRAVVYGGRDDAHVVELVDIDGGKVAWRDAQTCAGPVVGVTAKVAVCADGKGTHAIALATGALEWETELPFLAMDGARVAIAGGSAAGAIVLRAADTGDELGQVALPPGIAGTSIVATCGPHEAYAANPDGNLAKLVDAKVAWTAPTVQLEAVEACTGDTLLVTERTGHLKAIARATGKVVGELAGVRGSWPARDGGDAVEVATASATLAYGRDLAGPGRDTGLGAFGDEGGELIAKRGGVRLVRVTPRTAALVDARGVRAYVPFGELGGALGDRALVAASWQGGAGETLHRRLLPDPARARPSGPPNLARHGALDVAAELRDLPPAVDTEGEVVVAARSPDVDAHGVAEVALDPLDPGIAYVVAPARAASDLDASPASTVGRADLRAPAWTWLRADACGPGTPAPIAIARDTIACASQSPRAGGTVRATGLADGKPRWELRADAIDGVLGGGDLVVATVGDRARVLDAATGAQLGAVASDDGQAPRVAIVVRGVDTWLASIERGALVIRVPRAGMRPILAFAVHGAVRGLAAVDDAHVLVDLEAGDAYVVDLVARTAAAVASANPTAIAADHEWITTRAPGGPLYGPYPVAQAPVVRAPLVPPLPRRPVPAGPVDTMVTPPTLPTPVAPPPRIGTAWQFAMFAPGGGLGARNDFDLPAPQWLAPSARAPHAPFAVRAVDRGEPGPVLTLDARTGDPLRRIATRQTGAVFSTIVDGKPVLGMAVAEPLRIVAF